MANNLVLAVSFGFKLNSNLKYENVIIGAIKRNTQHIRLGTPEREHKGRKLNKAIVLFNYLKLPKKLNSDLENLISFLMTYIGLYGYVTE